ncbi:mitochondrial ribosomal protein S22 [Leptinotarsa decemlineata]|uniref:mitochondrial ribosomal protein S22 n=1 Tax=Leptinotarsa decemlineata TaxID=7539 RepID=UPI000C252321|nr:28S ribosomal protein S22, mitochondrial [Leptinotarsa decemlineata]
MAALRHISRKLYNLSFKPDSYSKTRTCAACFRLLNYSAIEYSEEQNPAPLFFDKQVQHLLRSLTRVDLAKVNRRRKVGDTKISEPEYKFMTDEQLQQAIQEAEKTTEELLQIPPVVAVRIPKNKVLSRDPALQGLDESKMVFTDITFGVKDSDRLIVVREPDGTLREAEWEMRNRINQIYFPKKERSLKPAKMFFGKYLESLLDRKEYEFILDRACIEFEPNEPNYQQVVSITYQHANDNNGFELLRSTRHFGAMTFFLVWNKNIDNLLLELIETIHLNEAKELLKLFSKIHNVNFDSDTEIEMIEEYIKKYSTKKATLELAMQAYKDLEKQRNEVQSAAHGSN